MISDKDKLWQPCLMRFITAFQHFSIQLLNELNKSYIITRM